MNFSYRNQLVLSQILTLFLTSKGGDSVVEDDLRTEAETLLLAIESSVVEIDDICEKEAKNNADDEDDDACDECCDDVVEYDKEPKKYESLFDDVLSLPHVHVKCISPSNLCADKMYDIHFVFKDERLSLYAQRDGFKKSGKCYKTIFVGYVDNLSMHADNNLLFLVKNDGDGIGITTDIITFQFDVENDLDNVNIWKREFDVPVNAVITFVA